MNILFKVRIITITTIFFMFLASGVLLSADNKGKSESQSHHFFAFDEAEYHTSPDKRIGAKILVDPAKVGPSISSMVHLTYLPGAHIKSHRHVFVTEIVHVLEGNLTLRIGDQVKTMGPGSTAWIPPKAFHEYLNDSADIVKFLQYFSPAGPEEEYRNWVKPEDDKKEKVEKKTDQSSEEDEPANMVSPPLPEVPGTPEPRLGGVKDTSKPGTSADNLPELKFKSEQADND
ncbi:MAG: cupin domain-containing protein [Candidatus Rifleibacteriota bacterium]